MSTLTDFTATELIEKLSKKIISPAEIISDALKRIKETDSVLQAWEYINEEAINAQLKKLDQYTSKPLYGIPIGVKDIYNTFDMPTQMGSPLWKDFTPGNDARVVHNLRLQGSIILGKTTTAEFAVHYQDKTRNPYNLLHSPGTSSAGSAVSVASGAVPIALGSQTAGSICRPASYCGVYGMKPTFGIIPRTGVLKTTDSLDTVGFFSRSIEDLQLMFNACRVSGKGYEFVHRYIDNYSPKRTDKFRVLFVKHPKWELTADFARKSIESFVLQLEKLPHIELSHAVMPIEAYQIHEIHERIYNKALSYYFAKEAKNHTLVSPIFYDIVEKGQNISTEQYLQDLNMQAKLSQWFNEYYSEVDIIVTLSTACDAPVGLTTPDIPDSNLIWTFLGMPTISVPSFTSPNGLPFGSLFIAKKYDDLMLLNFLHVLKDSQAIRDTKPIGIKTKEF